MKLKFISMCMAAVMAVTTLTSCDEETLAAVLTIVDLVLGDDGETTIVTDDGHGLGWLEREEDTEHIEDDIVLNPYKDSEIDRNTGLPTSVDLSVYLPPIGDQGQYGTCTAWATAYNSRTWLYAKSKNVRGTSLSRDHIFSAADLFRSISDANKGTKCQGSAMEAALDVMVKRGVASVSTVPDISDYSQCSCAVPQAANTEAAKYKIASYREIDIKDVRSVKRYLSEGRIIVFGAKLGDNFMLCNNEAVITSNGTFNHTGIHAYHAMACVGYDDNKGSNGAFKLVNSWGKSWGNNGFAWVDCKFFCGGEFAYCGFVINDLDENKSSVGDIADGEEKADVVTSDKDLVITMCNDNDFDDPDDADSQDPRWRTLYYDAANAGEGTVLASDTWGICYMLYNAYDANQSEMVLFDLYTDKIGDVKKGEYIGDWDRQTAMSILGCQAQGFSITNVDVPGRTSVCAAVTNDPDQCFSWSYKLPQVTGDYYLVLAVDAFNSVVESDNENNYYFLMGADNKPLKFENGVLKSDITTNKALSFRRVIPKKNAVMPHQTAVNDVCPNTYTPQEIASVIDAHRRNGVIANKALRWLEENEGSIKPRRTVNVMSK
ncbi:MAG: C1 family peptidase [Bacteroidales bacterium]|nr:C1 family peptidase [Bacteroidales bacterium]